MEKDINRLELSSEFLKYKYDKYISNLKKELKTLTLKKDNILIKSNKKNEIENIFSEIPNILQSIKIKMPAVVKRTDAKKNGDNSLTAILLSK